VKVDIFICSNSEVCYLEESGDYSGLVIMFRVLIL